MIFQLDLLIAMSIAAAITASTVQLGVTTVKKFTTKVELQGLASAVRMYEITEDELPGDLDDLDLASGDTVDAWGNDYTYSEDDREICSDNSEWDGGEKCVKF